MNRIVSYSGAQCAAAVLTYDRVLLATRTVHHLLEVEGFAGEDVFVVVNSLGGVSSEMERKVNIVTLPMNRGPAGGMREALSVVAREGYDWVYLCEDDVGTLLEGLRPRVGTLLRQAQRLNPRPAAILSYGRSVDPRSGATHPILPVQSATGSPLVPCDVGAWGATLVNLSIVYPHFLPDESLWFGYEDFDFFMNLAKGGQPVLLDVQAAAELGTAPHPSGRTEAYQDSRAIDDTAAWRRYYEARNFLVLARRYGTAQWVRRHLLLSLRRASLGGPQHWLAIGRGLRDGAVGRMGPNEKYQR